MKLVQNENHIISGYICESCKFYNDILSNPCKICQNYHNDSDVKQLAIKTQYNRLGFSYSLFTTFTSEYLMANEELTAELHSKFFNHEITLIKDMDNSQLRERRLEMQRIAFEARARLTAMDSEEKDRNSKGKRNAEWLINTGNDPNVTDAIAVVKERKARMTKIEKLHQQMKSLGIDNADELIRNVERTASNDQVKSISTQTTKKDIPIPEIKLKESKPINLDELDNLFGE